MMSFLISSGASSLTTQRRGFLHQELELTTDDTAGVSIGGANTLIIGSGGLTDNANVVNSIDSAITLGVSQTWTNNTATPLSVTGAIGGSGINLSLAGAGAFNFSGSNSYSGATSLTSNRTTLTLSGASGSLNNTSSLTLEGGTTLNIDNTLNLNANRINDLATINSKGATIASKRAGRHGNARRARRPPRAPPSMSIPPAR